jgi:hypothetical protein
MRRRNLILLTLLIFLSTQAISQSKKKFGELFSWGNTRGNASLLYGLNQGNISEFEIGISRSVTKGKEYCDAGFITNSITYSSAIGVVFYDNFLLDLKFSVWMRRYRLKPFIVGLNFNSYTNFNNVDLNFRPDIGITFPKFSSKSIAPRKYHAKLCYGYNFSLSQKLNIGNHFISLIFYREANVSLIHTCPMRREY